MGTVRAPPPATISPGHNAGSNSPHRVAEEGKMVTFAHIIGLSRKEYSENGLFYTPVGREKPTPAAPPTARGERRGEAARRPAAPSPASPAAPPSRRGAGAAGARSRASRGTTAACTAGP